MLCLPDPVRRHGRPQLGGASEGEAGFFAASPPTPEQTAVPVFMSAPATRVEVAAWRCPCACWHLLPGRTRGPRWERGQMSAAQSTVVDITFQVPRGQVRRGCRAGARRREGRPPEGQPRPHRAAASARTTDAGDAADTAHDGSDLGRVGNGRAQRGGGGYRRRDRVLGSHSMCREFR